MPALVTKLNGKADPVRNLFQKIVKSRIVKSKVARKLYEQHSAFVTQNVPTPFYSLHPFFRCIQALCVREMARCFHTQQKVIRKPSLPAVKRSRLWRFIKTAA